MLRKGDADDVCEGKIREVETAFRKFRIGEKVDVKEGGSEGEGRKLESLAAVLLTSC